MYVAGHIFHRISKDKFNDMYVYIYGINNMIWIRGYHMGHKTYNMIYSGCNGIFHGISNRIFYRIEKHM